MHAASKLNEHQVSVVSPNREHRGGAAFIPAYLIALAVVALPIMMLEVGAGRLAQGSVVGTFRTVGKIGTIFGWFVVLLTVPSILLVALGSSTSLLNRMLSRYTQWLRPEHELFE